jgi:WD40 repeat protein
VEKINNVRQSFGIGTVKFSPNGVFLAFGTTTGTVKFWQANNNFFYNGPKHPLSNYVVLTFSPDSNFLLSAGGDSFSRLTKRDGTGQHSIVHGDWVEDAAFSPDGSWYVTVSDDNRVRVIDTASGEEKIRMSHSDFIQKVKVSGDGKWIAATGYDQVVRIWDSASGSLMLEFPLEANGSAVSFNKDATRIVAADESGAISIWDISSLAARVNYIEFTEFAHEAFFTPSGDYLIVNTDDYNVWKIPAEQVHQIHDGTTGDIILRAQSLTYDVAVSPDSNWLAVAEFDNVNPQFNKATLVSLDGGSSYSLDHGGEVTAVGFSPDGERVITAGTNGRLDFWNIETQGKQLELDNTAPVYSLAIEPASNLIAVGSRDTVNIWDLASQSLLVDLRTSGNVLSITFSPDGTWLAAGSSGGNVTLWKREGEQYSSTEKNLQVGGALNMLTFSPDGKFLAGADTSGFAYLWDLATIQEVNRIRHTDPVTSVSFSPEGSHLITVSRKIVRVWDLTVIPPVAIDELIPFACRRLTANFSRSRWAGLFSEEPYRLICPDLPEDS